MLYKNIKVETISLVVYLKDKASENWKINERTVLKWLNKNNIKAGVENPIDDLVFIQFEKLDINLLTEVYKKAEKDFEEVKVNLYLDDFIEDEGNSIDLSLEEFLKLNE